MSQIRTERKTFTLAGVAFNMIYIPPGEFLMGSPEKELGRWEDERLHKVELTRGYWLAETACTQALWTAVMGENPSQFQGAERPVENVSWDDCQRFLERTEELSPGLALCLPTEAQWEYACRAGTRTPFSFGEQITTDQVNCTGNYPYASGKLGWYRGETVVVRSLPPNPWGLCEMHGNVWEWCADWYGEYKGEAVRDPQGPSEGWARVVRGGSWLSYARSVRAGARRDWIFVPGTRRGDLGFRLARG